jgi:hypothetical protein
MRAERPPKCGFFTRRLISTGLSPVTVILGKSFLYLKTRAGAEIKDVRVVIAPASILTGRVLSASGRTPLSRVSVMLIPADPSTAPAFARPYGSTNEQGTFLVSGAPGEYFLVLWGRGEPLPPHDVDSIKKLSPNAMRVTLGPGERKSMDLVK